MFTDLLCKCVIYEQNSEFQIGLELDQHRNDKTDDGTEVIVADEDSSEQECQLKKVREAVHLLLNSVNLFQSRCMKQFLKLS